jgi:hypothetical protein
MRPFSSPRRMQPPPNGEWTLYRTRFLVRARALTEPLNFVDALGREHNGGYGDYLVESANGLRCIASRRVFEDIYVALEGNESAGLPRRGPISTTKNAAPPSPGREFRSRATGRLLD